MNKSWALCSIAHRYYIAVICLVLVIALPACSNRQVYDAIQQNRQLECQKLPGTQYEECMKQVSEPYDAYQRERDELTGKESSP